MENIKENIKDFIIDYIQREYTLPADIDIRNFNFVETGYIDSLGLIQFIAVIEDEFDITFSDDDLASDDIKVIGKLVNFVSSKMRGNSK